MTFNESLLLLPGSPHSYALTLMGGVGQLSQANQDLITSSILTWGGGGG